MPSLNSITFDTTAFTFIGDDDNAPVWHTEDGDGIITGWREATVIDELLQRVEIKIDSDTYYGPIPGWQPDAVDPAVSGFTGNRSEDEKYDEQFPTHPLSKVRLLLHHIQMTVYVTDEVRNAPKFVQLHHRKNCQPSL